MNEPGGFLDRMFHREDADPKPEPKPEPVPEDDVEAFLTNPDQPGLDTFEIQVWEKHTSDGDPVGKRVRLLMTLLEEYGSFRSLPYASENFHENDTRVDRLKTSFGLASRQRYLEKFQACI